MNPFCKAAWTAGLASLTTLGSAQGLLAIDNPADHGSDRAAFVTVQAFAGNDAIAMDQYGKGWQGSYAPRDGQNIGLLASRMEAGAQWDGYRLGVLHRAYALAQAGRNTSDLVVQYNTAAGYDTGRSYPLDYRLAGFEARGLHLSRRFALADTGRWQAHAGVGASLLRGTRAEVGDKVREALERIRALEKDLRGLRDKLASGQGTDLAAGDIDVDGVKVLAARVEGADVGALRTAVDQLKGRLGSAAIVLAAVNDGGRITIVSGVTADQTARLNVVAMLLRWVQD